MISKKSHHVFLIIVKIAIIISPKLIILGQDTFNESVVPFSDETWNQYKRRIHDNLGNGSITITQLEYLFNGNRSLYNIRDFRREDHDHVMEVNFSKYSKKKYRIYKKQPFRCWC